MLASTAERRLATTNYCHKAQLPMAIESRLVRGSLADHIRPIVLKNSKSLEVQISAQIDFDQVFGINRMSRFATGCIQ